MSFVLLKQTRRGFTLIELLVVIAIIGVLSSVVLASLSAARAKSRDSRRISDIEQIRLSLELFFDAFQSYPSTTPITSTATVEGGVQMLVTRNYIKQVPVPPVGGSATKYTYRGVTASDLECLAVGVACPSYFLGAALERADAPPLLTDTDQDYATPAIWGVYTATPTVGNAGGRVNGKTDCAGTASPATEYCYDIKP